MATEWNGEGVPPVGTECEATWGGKVYWARCFILPEYKFYIQTTCGWQLKEVSGLSIEFRPLQSEEQKQVAEIVAILKKIGVVSDEITAKAIYNAGFRKVVE